MNWEVSMMESIQANMGKAGEIASKVFTTIGGETVLLALLIVIIFCYSKEAGKRCALKLLLACMWFPMIKNIVLRLRPYMEHSSIRALEVPEEDAELMDVVQQGYSLPSGHSAMSLAMFGSLSMEVKKKWLWIVGCLMVLLIGVSRFCVGVHYPTDVLAGWGVGLVAILFAELLEKKVQKEWVKHAILLAVTVPGIFWCTSRDYFSALGCVIAYVIAIPFERKFINFKDTRNVWAMILRAVGAMAIYLGLNWVLKKPFSTEFLNNGTLGANLIRTARYAVILFVILGVYPKIFPLFEKVGMKKQ